MSVLSDQRCRDLVGDFRLNKNTKRAWVGHLLEEDRQQTAGRLCRRDRKTGQKSYCCLGVLGEQKRLFVKWDYYSSWEDTALVIDDLGDSQAGYLPDSVIPSQIQRYLSDLNDEYGWTFPQIAEWIDTYL